MSETIEQLMNEYADLFDDQFPLMLMQGATDDEIEASLKKCIELGKPYEADLDLKY